MFSYSTILWEGPKVFSTVSSLLNNSGYKTSITSLPSTRTISPRNPLFKDDVAAVREHLPSIISSSQSDGNENAIQGLSETELLGEQGKPGGGVLGTVLLAGAIYPTEHRIPLFAVVEGGALHCSEPGRLLFGDLPAEQKEKWLAVIQAAACAGVGRIAYAGWKVVPSVYLICEGDNALPVALQERLAGLAGSRVERCAAGHIPQISMPERVVDVIEGFGDGALNAA
ncbi:hypothetical protein BDV12DRAFT_188962 [Aspergillus spectabilis]